jgi:hypothetical protein
MTELTEAFRTALQLIVTLDSNLLGIVLLNPEKHKNVKAKEGQASMTRRNRSRLLSTAILTTRSISLSMTRTVTASGTCRFTTWISMSPLISSVTTLTDELLRHVTKITRWRSESLRGGQALAVFSGTVAGCSGSAYIESIGSSRSITSSYSPNPLKRFAKTRP